MTEHNIFQEIESDLAQQKYEELWKRYGAWILGAMLAAVLTTAGISWWHTKTATRNQTETAALFKIVDASDDSPDLKKQVGELEAFSAGKRGAHETLARLDAAALENRVGDSKKAAAMYDAVANDSGVETIFRQFAVLMSVRAQMDTGDAAQLAKRLDPLVTDDVVWHYTALEYQAFLALRAGEKDKALRIFTALSQDARAPKTLGALASDMMHYLSE